jgi:hypothetical protein
MSSVTEQQEESQQSKRAEWAAKLIVAESKDAKDGRDLPTLSDIKQLQATQWQFIHPWNSFHVSGCASFVLIGSPDEKKRETNSQSTTWQAQFHDAYIFEIREKPTNTFVRFVPYQITGKSAAGLKLCSTSESVDGHAVSLAFMTRATDVLEKQWPYTKSVPQSLFAGATAPDPLKRQN